MRMQQILFRAMGCEIFCGIDSAHPRAHARLAQVPAMFEAWEQTLSRFRPDSELSMLNARAGQTVRVSNTLLRVLQLAQRAAAYSDYLIVPTIHDALCAAGYDQSFENMPRALSQHNASAAINARAQTWTLDAITHSVTLARDTHLDLNGVAKGWAAEQTANYLGELGPALVDAGGDMVMTAPRANGESWSINIEDPFAPERDNAAYPLLAIACGAVATSGRAFRQWQRDNKPMHHLIDPRTGLPAVTDVVNATVIAPDIFQAEVAAKVLMLRGSAEGMKWIHARPQLAALAILENGALQYNARIQEFFA